MHKILDAGSKKQLFLNEGLCAASENIRLTMNLPTQIDEPVLQLDRDYETCLPEASIGSYCSVLKKEDGKIGLWYFYHAGKDFDKRRLCYSESNDGINFTKPDLNIHEMGNTMANNAVIADPIQGGCVWLDPNAPPEEKYKTQAKGGPIPGEPAKLIFYASPDGINWKKTHQLSIGDCDTQNVVFWDDRYQCYVMYTRFWERFENINFKYRKVRRLESDDLVEWKNEQFVWEADSQDLAKYQTSTGKPPVDYYGACVYKYPDSNLYICLAQAFWHWKDRPEHEKWGFSPDPKSMDKMHIRLAPSTMDVRLGYSTDGKSFNRAIDRGPFMRNGLAGSFDSKLTWAMPDPIIMGDEIWIYYVGGNKDHDGFVDPASSQRLSGIGRAVMRLDGYVSADAGYKGGWLTTPLLTFSGKKLVLNMDTSGGGSVQVEIQDENGNPIKGYTKDEAELLTGNEINMPVKWEKGGCVQRLAGVPIRLKFYMQDAKLYSFQFK